MRRLALAMLTAVALPALAQTRVDARIGDAAAGVQGRIAINQAAGSGNVQANLAALAPGGLSDLGLRQQTRPLQRVDSARAVIDAQALAGGQGLLSVNQAAGSGNAQANLFALDRGPAALSVAGDVLPLGDAALAAVAGDTRTEGSAIPPTSSREAAITGDAFRGSQGVLQVNQTAGVGNASVNAIVLQLPGGGAMNRNDRPPSSTTRSRTMKLHRTLLAIGLASMFAAAPAFAADDEDIADTDTVVSLWDITDTTGLVTIDGMVSARARSGATVEQTQATTENLMIGDIDSDASLGDALSGASGNIGVNIGAGTGNAQSNDVALATLGSDASRTYASAMVFSDQTALGNAAAEIFIGDFTASVGDGALAGAMGNIGVNVGSGVGNAQSNALAASVNSEGRVAYATTDSNQEAAGNLFLGIGLFDTIGLGATLDGGALADASGNIGVNIAAGVGNVQHNSLSLSSNGGL